MSASNKALIAFIAVVAFVVGAAIKSTHKSDDVNTQTLLPVSYTHLTLPTIYSV